MSTKDLKEAYHPNTVDEDTQICSLVSHYLSLEDNQGAHIFIDEVPLVCQSNFVPFTITGNEKLLVYLYSLLS